MNTLHISTSTDEETAITTVSLEGFLDADTVLRLRKVLFDLIKEGHYKLIIDLKKLQYISSAGVGVFIGVIKRVRENSGDIIFLQPLPTVYRVLDILGLTKIFKILEQEKEAVDELNKI
ncbi:MAG: STAS domain-containing protein [Nitrospirae bacterium]|nr:STAS domain-containing protein [Nitrospirota bacterium]